MTSSISPIVVIPLRSEEVPEDFVCAVCLSIPIHPWIIKECHHVFCKDCLHQCLAQQKNCPVCRTATDSMAPMCTESPLAHRIWSGIAVKCQHHDDGCGWTGSIYDYEAHAIACEPHKFKKSRADLAIRTCKDTIRKLRKSVQKLKAEAERKDRRYHELEQETRELRVLNQVHEFLSAEAESKDRSIRNLIAEVEQKDRRYRTLERETRELRKLRDSTAAWRLGDTALLEETAETMRRELDQLKTMVATTLETPWTNGRGGYSYDRNSVVKLTKLICQNLERKPPAVDSNKIFDCVVRIGSDLRKQLADNPDHLFVDVRLLVCVCLASTWFTPNQVARIRELATDQFCADEGVGLGFERQHPDFCKRKNE